MHPRGGRRTRGRSLDTRPEWPLETARLGARRSQPDHGAPGALSRAAAFARHMGRVARHPYLRLAPGPFAARVAARDNRTRAPREPRSAPTATNRRMASTLILDRQSVDPPKNLGSRAAPAHSAPGRAATGPPAGPRQVPGSAILRLPAGRPAPAREAAAFVSPDPEDPPSPIPSRRGAVPQ